MFDKPSQELFCFLLNIFTWMQCHHGNNAYELALGEKTFLHNLSEDWDTVTVTLYTQTQTILLQYCPHRWPFTFFFFVISPRPALWLVVVVVNSLYIEPARNLVGLSSMSTSLSNGVFKGFTRSDWRLPIEHWFGFDPGLPLASSKLWRRKNGVVLNKA